MRRRPLGCPVRLLLGCWLVLFLATTVSAEPAALRIVAHPRFVRLVVEPSAARVASLDRVGTVARLRFDRPLRIDVPPIPAGAATALLLAEAREGGTRLALALGPGVDARLIEPGPGRIVVDLVPSIEPDPLAAIEPAAAPAPPMPPGPGARPLRVRTGSHPGYRRIVVEGPEAARLVPRIEGGLIEITGRAEQLAPILRGLQSLESEVARATVQGDRLAAELRPGVLATRRQARADQLVLDLTTPTATSTPPRNDPPVGEPGGYRRPSGTIDAATAGGREASGGSAPGPTTAAPTRCPGPAGADRLCVERVTTADGEELRLASAPRPGAAVLWRAGALWVVLDRVVERVDVESGPASDGSGLVTEVRHEPHPDATVLRVATRSPVAAEAEPGAEGWRLRLRPSAAAAPASAGPVTRRHDPPGLLIDGVGTPIVLPATLTGSDVAVLAIAEARSGAVARRLVDLELLPAAQGIAWRAVADDLRIRRLGDRTLIDRADGLRLDPEPSAEPPAVASLPTLEAPSVSVASAAPERASTAPTEPTVPAGPVPVGSARSDEPRAAPTPSVAARPPVEATPPTRPEEATAVRGPPAPVASAPVAVTPSAPVEVPIGLTLPRSAAGVAVSGAHGRAAGPSNPASAEDRASIDRMRARDELARLRAAEALALLGDPPAASDDQAEPPADLPTRALAGVAAVLLDRVAAGERLLDDPRLAGDAEAALWRGVAAARRQDWARAEKGLAGSGRTFQSYPAALQRRLAPTVARTLIEQGRTAPAFAVVDLARRHAPDERESARLSFVEGLGLLREGNLDAAAATLRAAAEGSDRTTAIEARYRLARLEHERSRLGLDELLAELGRQRLHWRDHPAEPAMLDGLIGLQLADGRIGEALDLSRELLLRHPASAPAAGAAGRMRERFEAALAGDGAGAPDALAALRLLRAHLDLMPEGERGLDLLRGLAGRLATAGLPGVAAAVLDEHGLGRARADQRADLLLQIAELRLRADEPAAALAAIDAASAQPTVRPEAALRARELRRMAQARSAAGEAATADAGGPRSRLEAAWRQRDWRTVAEIGRMLIDAATANRAADPETALVPRVALALAATGQREEARALLARRDGQAAAPRGRALLALLDAPTPLRGDALQVAAAIDGELATLRAGLDRSR